MLDNNKYKNNKVRYIIHIKMIFRSLNEVTFLSFAMSIKVVTTSVHECCGSSRDFMTELE